MMNPRLADKPVLLRARNLARSFGPVQAVQDLSLELHAGTIVGFIGMNGAGKTTTLRMLATLDNPDHGSIDIDGTNALEEPRDARRRLGWMPDAFDAYPRLSVREYLEFFAAAHGLRRPGLKRRVAQVAEFAGLDRLMDRPSTRLSKGETQRLSVARMLIQDPPILLMDEPAAGLDPKARVEFRQLVRAMRDQGKALFISSHILSDLEELCDDLVFIDQGRVIHRGTVGSVRAATEAGQRVRVRVHGDPEGWRQWVQLQPGVTLEASNDDGGIVLLEGGGPQDAAGLLAECIRAGHAIYEFQRVEANLEDAFLRIVQGNGNGKESM